MSEQPIMLGNRYRLDEVIGRGGMAEVWRAWDTRLGRDVAVKRLRIDLATDPTFQARFQREAQSAAGLNHPNIVAVYDTGAEMDPASGVDIPFIVMELVQGTTLRDLLRDGRQILPERSLEFTGGVLDGLAYAHKRGIVHRDIKPGNVMLTTTGSIKVMDFGIARAVSETSATMTQTAAVIGTAQYLSPEQARGETVDARSDLYSVGCLLYELLTSRPPFVGDSPVSVAYQHVREQPIPPSQIDAELTANMDTVVLGALAKDPNTRYQTAQAMRDDVQRLLDAKTPLGAAGPAAAAVPSARVHSDRLPPGARPRRGFTETNPTPVVVAPPLETQYDPVYDEEYYDEPESAEEMLPTGAMGAQAPDRRMPILIIALVGLVIVMLTVGGFVLRGVMQPPPPPTTALVPYVVGSQEAVARQAIVSAQLNPSVIYEPGPAAEKGQVIRQSPDANTELEFGKTVEIWVNSGPEMGVIPEVRGDTESDARKALAAEGFKNILPSETAQPGEIDEPTDYVAGQVLLIEPAVGQSAPLDSPIKLTLSSGKSLVPTLIGQDRATAIALAKQDGFALDIKTAQSYSPDCQEGRVCTQVPVGGMYEFRNKKIFVTIGRAAPPPPPTTPLPTPTDENT